MSKPINTSVFDEAIVLSYNGVLTLEGLREGECSAIEEGTEKLQIDFAIQ